jgi:hypothetical protein
MPWHAARMGTRVATVALLLALTACTSEEPDEQQSEPISDHECMDALPDDVFTTLGWTPTDDPAEATIRGCHREANEGYVEVRNRTDYEGVCATVDHTQPREPAPAVDWLDDEVACGLEPDEDVGLTRVVVRRGDDALQITVAVLTPTDRALVREAVQQVLDASGDLG